MNPVILTKINQIEAKSQSSKRVLTTQLSTIPAVNGYDRIETSGYSEIGVGGASYNRIINSGQTTNRWRIPSSSPAYLWLLSSDEASVTNFGAKGDGVNSDQDALEDAMLWLKETRGRRLNFTQTGKAANSETQYVVERDLIYPAGSFLRGGPKVSLVAKSGSVFTEALLVDELRTIDATLAEFQTKKFERTLRDISVVMTNATSGHGISCSGDRLRLENIYVQSSPWCGIKLTPRGLNDSIQASGNMIMAYLRCIRINNFGTAFRTSGVNDFDIPEEKSIGLDLGYNQNGRITDGHVSDVGILSGPIGMRIGGSAGWNTRGLRIANVDDALVVGQPTRFTAHQIQIDDFGKGWDKNKKAFMGVFLRKLFSKNAHIDVQGQIQCGQQAGTTSDYTYTGCYIQSPDTDADNTGVRADFIMQLGHEVWATGAVTGTSSATSYGYYQSDDNNRNIRGLLTGSIRDVKYPVILPKTTNIYHDLNDAPIGKAGFSRRTHVQKTVTAGTATQLFVLNLGAVSANLIEIDVVANRNNGYAVGHRKFKLVVGDVGSGSASHVSSTIIADTLCNTSQSSSSRAVSDITLTAAAGGTVADGTVTLSVTVTFTGSSTDTAAVVTAFVRTFGDAPLGYFSA